MLGYVGLRTDMDIGIVRGWLCWDACDGRVRVEGARRCSSSEEAARAIMGAGRARGERGGRAFGGGMLSDCTAPRCVSGRVTWRVTWQVPVTGSLGARIMG